MSKINFHIVDEDSYNHSSDHFRVRLKERYFIDISDDEYNSLINGNGFIGKFSKNENITIGTILINDTLVYCVRSSKTKLLLTALPESVGTDYHQAIRACFPAPIRPFAEMVYDTMMEEIYKAKIDFKTDKEAALFYFKECIFAPILIDKYKTNDMPPTFRVCHQIRLVIKSEHPKLRFTLASAY
jgi:hypothetical protein